MEIIWDSNKYLKLRLERNIDLEEIRGLIESKQYLEILENRKRPDQVLIVLEYKSYVHVVPVKIEKTKMIIKTCFPSRRANAKHKGDKK